MVDFKQISSDKNNLVGFKTTIGGDYVRPWLYGIEIPFIEGNTHRRITALSRSVTFPGYSVKEATDASFNGIKLSYASKPDFEKKDLKITLLSDHKMSMYKSFLTMAANVAEPGRIYPKSPLSYKNKQIVSIYQLNKKGYPIIIFNFYGIWVQSVGSWTGAQNSTTPVQFDVNLKYDYYNINKDPVIDDLEDYNSDIINGEEFGQDKEIYWNRKFKEAFLHTEV